MIYTLSDNEHSVIRVDDIVCMYKTDTNTNPIEYKIQMMHKNNESHQYYYYSTDEVRRDIDYLEIKAKMGGDKRGWEEQMQQSAFGGAIGGGITGGLGALGQYATPTVPYLTSGYNLQVDGNTLMNGDLKVNGSIKQGGVMLDAVKGYIQKHRDFLMTLVLVLVVDHIVFKGALREKVKGVIDEALTKVHKDHQEDK